MPVSRRNIGHCHARIVKHSRNLGGFCTRRRCGNQNQRHAVKRRIGGGGEPPPPLQPTTPSRTIVARPRGCEELFPRYRVPIFRLGCCWAQIFEDHLLLPSCYTIQPRPFGRHRLAFSGSYPWPRLRHLSKASRADPDR